MIDVKQIMEEIRNDIQTKGYSSEMLSFNDVEVMKNINDNQFSQRVFDYILSEMKKQSNITWRRPVEGGLSGFVKRVIQFFMRFIIEPMSNEQNLYNSYIAREMSQISAYFKEQNKALGNLKKENEELKKIIAELQKNIKE